MGHRTYSPQGPETHWGIMLACVAGIVYGIIMLILTGIP
jgi:hypothetical protein